LVAVIPEVEKSARRQREENERQQEPGLAGFFLFHDSLTLLN
jgi:hypothetical protein